MRMSTRFAASSQPGWDKPWILYTAALFHDIAKGRGGDHSDLGADRSQNLSAASTALTKQDAQLIAFLVQHHLVMSSTAQKQDLSDPDVIDCLRQKSGQ